MFKPEEGKIMQGPANDGSLPTVEDTMNAYRAGYFNNEEAVYQLMVVHKMNMQDAIDMVNSAYVQDDEL